MKLLLENWQEYLDENEEVVKKTFRIDGGRIVVIENSKWAGGAHSISGFFVDEDKRGKGLGKKLIQLVLNKYPGEEISAQVSSLASLYVMMSTNQRTNDVVHIFPKFAKVLKKVMLVPPTA